MDIGEANFFVNITFPTATNITVMVVGAYLKLAGRFSFPRPYNDTIFFCHRVTKFVTCVGIASVRLGEPSIHNHILKERRCRRGRPWASLRSLVSTSW